MSELNLEELNITVSEKFIVNAKKAIEDINQSVFTELGCVRLEDDDYGIWSYWTRITAIKII